MKGNGRWDNLREANDIPSKSLSRSISRGYDKDHSRHDRDVVDTVNGSWRKPGNASSAVAVLTIEEEKFRHAIDNLKGSIASYIPTIDSTKRNDCKIDDINKLLDELSHFASIRTNDSDSSGSAISVRLLWEAAEIVIHSLKQFNPLTTNKLIVNIPRCAVAFLQRIQQNIQESTDSFQRPKSMTDLRLCECASVLLSFLTRDGVDCKENSFTCLANIMALSRILGLQDGNNKNRRSLLFPWGAEKTINLVVMQAVLPFVKTVMSRNGAITNTSKISPAMECLYLLLRNSSDDSYSSNHHLSKHAAAILAPLVINVSPNGQENERVNPLRSSTIKIIVAFWNCTYQLSQEEDKRKKSGEIKLACECLISAISSLHALKRGKPHQAGNEIPPIEIDVASICRQIVSALQNQQHRFHHSSFLRLLTSLCQTYPKAAASQWYLFLEQPTFCVTQNRAENIPLLLKFMQTETVALKERNFKRQSISILPDVLHAISMLISAMPLSHWIVEENKPRGRSSSENYFASRIRSSMLRVIEYTYSLMVSLRDIISDIKYENCRKNDLSSLDVVMTHLSQLTVKLCSVLPFTGQNTMLLRPATKLVDCSGEIYILCNKEIDSVHSGLEFCEKASSIFRQIITDTVNVDSSQTRSPAQCYLSESTSFECINVLLSREAVHFEKQRLMVLSHVARICPWVLVREPFKHAFFDKLCSAKCDSHSNSNGIFSGVTLVESFLHGRHTFSSEFHMLDINISVVDTLCPMLLSALTCRDSKIRASAVASFGHMLEIDWSSIILQIHKNRSLFWKYLDSILQLSSVRGEETSRVRSSACKSVGDICTCILRASFCMGDFAITLSQKICHEMEHAINDDCSSVRSMGLFVVGNIALSLKEHHAAIPAIIDILPQLNTLFSSVYKCFDDKDEKVVVNAIRAAGQLSYFIYSPNVVAESKQCIATKSNLYKSSLSYLTLKVKRAIDDANKSSTAPLTWNQRNNVKKHAWGSCSAIGMLLAYSHMTCRDHILIESVLFEQFRCIQLSSTIHDKIVATAAHSLVNLPDAFWQQLSENCESISHGIISCFCYLYHISIQKTQLPSYHGDIQMLTHKLLLKANSNDFCKVLILIEETSFSVHFLYQWLVTNNVSAGVIETVAVAVQSEEVQQIIDVFVVQMFVSRTTHQIKENDSPRKSYQNDTAEDDEDDEL